MFHLDKIKCFSMIIASLSIGITNNTLAVSINNSSTIKDSSVQWDDMAGRSKLLGSVPVWKDDAVQSLFNAYQNPTRYQLPLIKNVQSYNIQFINAFWGPLDNPFNKYPRPAKAFIIIDKAKYAGEKTSETFYMAPLIHNWTDGNYYIFEKNQSQPVLLNDWVATIRNIHGYKNNIRFNICNGYGNAPTDSCDDKSYQNETADVNKALTKQYSAASSTIPSAHRDIHEDWQSNVKKTESFSRSSSDYIYSESIPWNDLEARNKLLSTVVAWSDYNTVKDNFLKIRNMRYFQEENRVSFLRRITWLYPDDGCWTRAAAVIKDLFGPFNSTVNNFSRPSKVFAFGNLCANTPNNADGRVSWWYHTAPIVRDAETNVTYVLDPSVSPHEPITMENWVAAISSQTGACAGSNSSVSKFNVCNGYASGPYDSCKNTIYASEAATTLSQSTYRYYERERQINLGRDADKVLGDLPPWTHARN